MKCRFLRFAKEFGIVPGGHKSVQLPPMLVQGDIDVLYKVALKESDSQRDITYHQIFLSEKHKSKGKKHLSAHHMSPEQFICAVRQIATKLYARLIEQQTGTSLELLPVKMQDAATRAAMEAMNKQKILPVADSLGLLPWPLVYLDRTLSTLHENSTFSQTIISMSHRIESWFLAYSQINSVQRQALSPTVSESMNLTYKSVSRFAHDFGIVPYLIKESQLFSNFEEVSQWTKNNPRILSQMYPQEIYSLETAEFELKGLLLSQLHDTESQRHLKIGILAFILLLSTVAMQTFPEIPPQNRIEKLITCMIESGGESRN